MHKLVLQFQERKDDKFFYAILVKTFLTKQQKD